MASRARGGGTVLRLRCVPCHRLQLTPLSSRALAHARLGTQDESACHYSIEKMI
jgi:hypothetical protein